MPDDIFLSDTYRIPLAVERGPGGERTIRPHEADPQAVQRCPACGCVVRRYKRKALYFRHPQGGETCNAESVLHPYAVKQMRLLLLGVDRVLLRLEIAEPRHPGVPRRAIWQVPAGDATAANHRDPSRNLEYDVVHLRGGQVQLAIEIRHTHPVDADKRSRMPQPWFEIQARNFLRPEVAAALAAIEEGRRVEPVLRLQGVGPPGHVTGPTPPPTPEPPSDLPLALRKYRARVERLRASDALDRGVVLLGEPCQTHPGARMQCRIPPTAWTDSAIGDPVHDGAHLLLRNGPQIVLGILVVGAESQINQIKGRPLALHRPIPLALVPVDLLPLLMRHVPVQLNSHALSGPWHCPVCERLAMDARRREAQDRQVKELQATIAHILQHHTDLVASRSLPPDSRVDEMIEREISPYLIGADDDVAARIGGAWRAIARALAATHRQRQAEIERQKTAWRETLWPLEREIERATTREEIVSLSQRVAVALPDSDVDPTDITTARSQAVLKLQTQASHRLEVISKPAWRLSHAQNQAIEQLHAAHSAADMDAILTTLNTEIRDIEMAAGAKSIESTAIRTRMQVEIEYCRTTRANGARESIHATMGRAIAQAHSIEEIDALRPRFKSEIALWAETWRTSPDEEQHQLQETIRRRITQGVPGGITARADAVLRGQVDQAAVDRFRCDMASFVDRVRASVSADGAVPEGFEGRCSAHIDIEILRLNRARLAPAIWASWLPVQRDVMSRWGTPWNRQDQALMDDFRVLLAHHRVTMDLAPDTITAACAVAESGGDHWKVRGAIRDARPPAGLSIGPVLAAPGGIQESIF